MLHWAIFPEDGVAITSPVEPSRLKRRRAARALSSLADDQPPTPQIYQSNMRIYAVSDVHIDYKENWNWALAIPAQDHLSDTLIVAGDVAHSMEKVEAFLLLMTQKFGQVFFVPGNHELWVLGQEAEHHNSLEKFDEILLLCGRLGVHTTPQKLSFTTVDNQQAALWIVPLFSWYSNSLDDIEVTDEDMKNWVDFSACKWPAEVCDEDEKRSWNPQGAPCSYFLSLNADALSREYDAPVMTFSHFLPRRECLPRPLYPTPRPLLPPLMSPLASFVLLYKPLPLVSGTLALDAQLRRINSKLHFFGHTHINWDRTIDGVRYVQTALKYPRERQRLPERWGHADLDRMKLLDSGEELPDWYTGKSGCTLS